jgi:hypothetical protein
VAYCTPHPPLRVDLFHKGRGDKSIRLSPCGRGRQRKALAGDGSVSRNSHRNRFLYLIFFAGVSLFCVESNATSGNCGYQPLVNPMPHIAASACAANPIASPANPTGAPPFPAHPSILTNQTEITHLKALIAAKDPTAVKLFDNVTAHENVILSHYPNPFPIPAANSLSLSTAREIQDIIATSAGLYLLTGNTEYSNRALAEMTQVANYPDWNAANDFLTTAETIQAMAIGFDWLYALLTPAQSTALVNAMVKNGLQPGLVALAKGEYNTPNSNWTAVVNGGILNGALAIATQQPSLLNSLIPYVQANLKAVSSLYAPYGGWVEGPGYFTYATKYFSYAVASLQTTLGTDWGLSNSSGYNLAGDFGVYENSPTTLSFNFGDAGNSPIFGSFMVWLSRQFNQPRFGMSEYSVTSQPTIASDELYNAQQNSDFVMDLLWYTPCIGGKPDWPAVDHLSNGDAASGDAFVYLRSKWTNPDATNIALKGGNNVGSGHSHADIGSFVLDANGVRWGELLGGESYALPNMFPGGGASLAVWNERLYYYRNSTAGANTLNISATYQTLPSLNNQYGFGTAAVVGYSSTPDTLSFGVVDMTNAYSNVVSGTAPIVTAAMRGIALINNTHVLVRDEVTAASPVDVVWSMHTNAAIAITKNGTVATLTDPATGKTYVATLLSPTNGAAFSTASTNPNTVNLPYQWTGTNGCTAAANTWVDTLGCIENPNTGINNLIVRIPQAQMAKSNVTQVLFSQTGNIGPCVSEAITKLGTLSHWIALGPVSKA